MHFGSADHAEAKTFRHQMLLNSEDDIHFPTLTVTQTMRFALRNKAPDNRPAFLQSKDDYAEQAGNEILEQLGIAHTKDTLVGNEFVRGVSGGERKRVSIAEVMAGQVRSLEIFAITESNHNQGSHSVLGQFHQRPRR